jgi:hypothetical protein
MLPSVLFARVCIRYVSLLWFNDDIHAFLPTLHCAIMGLLCVCALSTRYFPELQLDKLTVTVPMPGLVE